MVVKLPMVLFIGVVDIIVVLLMLAVIMTQPVISTRQDQIFYLDVVERYNPHLHVPII